jgi:hypothetical protein
MGTEAVGVCKIFVGGQRERTAKGELVIGNGAAMQYVGERT